jgi:hypothetical protein
MTLSNASYQDIDFDWFRKSSLCSNSGRLNDVVTCVNINIEFIKCCFNRHITAFRRALNLQIKLKTNLATPALQRTKAIRHMHRLQFAQLQSSLLGASSRVKSLEREWWSKLL